MGANMTAFARTPPPTRYTRMRGHARRYVRAFILWLPRWHTTRTRNSFTRTPHRLHTAFPFTFSHRTHLPHAFLHTPRRPASRLPFVTAFTRALCGCCLRYVTTPDRCSHLFALHCAHLCRWPPPGGKIFESHYANFREKKKHRGALF